MCTALTLRSGLFLPRVTHHQSLWAEGQGEEEQFLLPRERARRRIEGGERRTKSRTPVQKSSSFSTWLVKHYCTITRSIHSIPGLHSINTISTYMFVHTSKALFSISTSHRDLVPSVILRDDQRLRFTPGSGTGQNCRENISEKRIYLSLIPPGRK